MSDERKEQERLFAEMVASEERWMAKQAAADEPFWNDPSYRAAWLAAFRENPRRSHPEWHATRCPACGGKLDRIQDYVASPIAWYGRYAFVPEEKRIHEFTFFDACTVCCYAKKIS